MIAGIKRAAPSSLRSSVMDEERMTYVGFFVDWNYCFEFPSVL